ncbi:fibroblast growth factor receptor-like isoform X2 [Dysidea avara]
MQYECAWDGLPPYYYYKYSNMTGPKFLARSDLKYLTIDKIDHCYHDVFICCQSRSNESSLAAMKCHHMNVTFHPQLTANTERLINRTYLPWINPLEPYYGQTLTLTCPLEGNPQASYKWYFLNETLQQRNDSFIMIDEEYRESNGIFPQNSSDHRQLTIDKFLEQHNGHYFCSAENYLGSDNFLFPLFQVWKCESFDPAHPSVDIINSTAAHVGDNITAHVGDNITIICKVASIPHTYDYSIVWYKNDEQLWNPSARVHDVVQDFKKFDCSRTSTLYITNATFNDSANYSCSAAISDYLPQVKTVSLSITLPPKQPSIKHPIYKLLLVGITLLVVLVFFGISITLAVLHYQRKRQKRLHQALEQYRRRPLPKKGHYKYEFFLAMTEEDKDKLKVDKLYMSLKESFSIYYQLDQYLPGRTKVEMVSEGIKNSRFIILLLTKAYLCHKDEVSQLELIYAMNRLEREFTKCVFIVALEDKLHIPYKLRHITSFSKKRAESNLRELASSSDEYGPDFADYLTTSNDEHQKEENFNENENGTTDRAIELLNLLIPDD